jgi:CDP-diacylglycerol--glycerol-3-phosphate 3-phosphatidyltransferase
MVSYVRARAEGLQIECKVGLMQRPERVVLTGAGALLCGIVQPSTFDPLLFLSVPLTVIALGANLTAVWRIVHCYRILKREENATNSPS